MPSLRRCEICGASVRDGCKDPAACAALKKPSGRRRAAERRAADQERAAKREAPPKMLREVEAALARHDAVYAAQLEATRARLRRGRKRSGAAR